MRRYPDVPIELLRALLIGLGSVLPETLSEQGKGNPSRDSHTFASFYNGDDLAHRRLKPATISWLPASGAVRLLRVERGHNFSLAQTLATACARPILNPDGASHPEPAR